MEIKLDIERHIKKNEKLILSFLEMQKDISDSIQLIVKEKFDIDLYCIQDLSINYNEQEKCIFVYKMYSNCTNGYSINSKEFNIGYKINVDKLTFHPYVEITGTLL